MACQWFNLAYGLFSLDTTRSGNLDMIHIYIYIPWTIEHIKLRHRSLFNFKSNLKGVVYLQVVISKKVSYILRIMGMTKQQKYSNRIS